MQTDLWEAVQAWAISLLIYPGLIFGLLLVLAGNWFADALSGASRSMGMGRKQGGRSFARPLYTALKLAGRQRAVTSPIFGSVSASLGAESLGPVGVLAPLLALSLLPLPGSPLASRRDAGDLLWVLALLALQPLVRALIRILRGGMEGLRGAQEVGRFFTGLVPTLAVVAALSEVSGVRSMHIADLMSAPESATQTGVRVLAGAVLLFALPWWLESGRSMLRPAEAAAYTGHLLQGAALAAFWAVLVLPAPGEFAWAILLYVVGSLFAHIAMRLIALRWAPSRREKDAANVAWLTTLPAAALALGMAFWPL